MRSVAKLLSVLAVVLSLVGVGRTSVVAQESENLFADLGLPEIAVTISETALEGVPAELTAGRYVLAVTNATEEDDLGVAFIQPPDGMTGAEFADMIAGMAAESEDAATPGADAAAAEASPVAEGEDSGIPPWYYEVSLAGGIYAGTGETSYIVIDLAAGEWALWAEDPSAPQAPVGVTVTGEAPADLPAPAADVTISTVEFGFEIEGELTAGSQIIEFRNEGAQPHFILLAGVPPGTTVDDFMALAATFGDPSATPPANLTFDQVTTAVDTGDQSSGVTSWLAADLEAGDYILVCFVGDQATGTPHAFMGMIDVITVQ